MTSNTDKVIAGIVGRLSFKKIMPPNARIELQDGDESAGHNFKDIYLKYRSARLSRIFKHRLIACRKMLYRMKINPAYPHPELTLAHKIEGAVPCRCRSIGEHEQ